MDPPPDMAAALADVARILDETGVPYALIGGLAVAIHTALPRATVGVDLAVRSDAKIERLVAAFHAKGFVARGRFEHTVNLRHPQGQPIQLTIDPAFDAAIDRAESFPVGGVAVRLVRREDLIALKELAAADPRRRRSKALRDRADVEMLRGDVADPEEGW